MTLPARDPTQSVDSVEQAWQQVASGGILHMLDPRPEEIVFEDIAIGLSNTCRYGGQLKKGWWYSVAEHSVLVAECAPAEFKLEALMHDASEAYIADIVRPIKPHLGNYYVIEDRLMRAISARFDLVYPTPKEVKRIDTAMLSDERAQILVDRPEPPEQWGNIFPANGVTIHGWAPEKAYFEFKAAFVRYGGRE